MPRAACVLVLAALLPTLAAAFDHRFSLSPGQMCGSRWQGKYAPFSAYESNLRRLAATVAAEVNASPCNCSVGRVAGDRPDQVSISAFCHWRPDATSSDCGACVALAFREARWRCPYHRQAVSVVDGGACSVSFHDVYRMEQSMGLGQPLRKLPSPSALHNSVTDLDHVHCAHWCGEVLPPYSLINCSLVY